MDERLYRSVDDRMLAGVAGGVAERLDTDPSIIRIVWALLIVLTGGIALVAYIVMAVVVPEAPDGDPAAPERPAPASPSTALHPDDATAVTEGSWLQPAGAPTTAAASATAGPAIGSDAAGPVAAPGVVSAPVADPGAATAGPPPTTTPPAGSWMTPGGQVVARATGPDAGQAGRHDQAEGRGAVLGGLILILIGAAFLARQAFPSLDLGRWWPLAVIAIGVLLVVMSVAPRRRAG